MFDFGSGGGLEGLRHIPRAIGPRDHGDHPRDPGDTTLPVDKSVWTTCGHAVSVRNELALAVRFE